MSINKLASNKSVKQVISIDPKNKKSIHDTSPLRKVFDKIIEKQHVTTSDVSLLLETILDEKNTTSEHEDTTSEHEDTFLDENILRDAEELLRKNKLYFPKDVIREALNYKFPVRSLFEKIRKKRSEILKIIKTNEFIDSLNADTDSLNKTLFARTKSSTKRRNTIGGKIRTENKCNKSRNNKRMKGGNFTRCDMLLIRLGLFFLSLSINMYTIEPICQIILSMPKISTIPITILILFLFIKKINTHITHIADSRFLRNLTFNNLNETRFHLWCFTIIFTYFGFINLIKCKYIGFDVVGSTILANLLNSCSVLNIIKILTDETYRQRLCGIEPRYSDYVNIKCPLGNDKINNFICPLCLEKFNKREPLLDLGLPINFHQNIGNTICNHIFHKKCIDNLILSTPEDTVKCPLCRVPIYKQNLSDTPPMTKDEFINCVCKE